MEDIELLLDKIKNNQCKRQFHKLYFTDKTILDCSNIPDDSAYQMLEKIDNWNNYLDLLKALIFATGYLEYDSPIMSYFRSNSFPRPFTFYHRLMKLNTDYTISNGYYQVEVPFSKCIGTHFESSNYANVSNGCLNIIRNVLSKERCNEFKGRFRINNKPIIGYEHFVAEDISVDEEDMEKFGQCSIYLDKYRPNYNFIKNLLNFFKLPVINKLIDEILVGLIFYK